MADPQVYALSRIRDLADVPMERLDDCLTDIRRLVMSVHIGRATFGDAMPALPETVEWRDDDDRTATVVLRAGRKKLAEIRVDHQAGGG